MNKITYMQLKTLKICEGQLQLFKDTFGEEVTFNSLEEAESLALEYAQVFDFDFLGETLFRKAYLEARAPLYKAYKEVEAPMLKAYKEVQSRLYRDYLEAKVPLYRAYGKAKAPFRKAYEEAEASLLKTYKETRAKLVAKMLWES